MNDDTLLLTERGGENISAYCKGLSPGARGVGAWTSERALEADLQVLIVKESVIVLDFILSKFRYII